MKVYIATSGSYSDYRIDNVFLNEADAKAYTDAQIHGRSWADASYDEWDVHEGPVERRTKYSLMWWPHLPDKESSSTALPNPYTRDYTEDWSPVVTQLKHYWDHIDVHDFDVLHVEGWDKQAVLKVYSEQRATYLARKEGIT